MLSAWRRGTACGRCWTRYRLRQKSWSAPCTHWPPLRLARAPTLKQPCTCRGAYTRTRTVCARRRLPPCAARTCTGAGARREGSMSKTRTGAIRPVPACWAVRWLPADVKCGVYCSSPVICTSRSAFYERLKDVRDYHRRYPYLEVSEVRSGAAGSPVPLSPRLAGYALALAALALRTPWGTWHWALLGAQLVSPSCAGAGHLALGMRRSAATSPCAGAGHLALGSPRCAAWSASQCWRWAHNAGHSPERGLFIFVSAGAGTWHWALLGTQPFFLQTLALGALESAAWSASARR